MAPSLLDDDLVLGDCDSDDEAAGQLATARIHGENPEAMFMTYIYIYIYIHIEVGIFHTLTFSKWFIIHI